MTYIAMAKNNHGVNGHGVYSVACIVKASTVMACVVMARPVMAYTVMMHVAMACTVIASTAMAFRRRSMLRACLGMAVVVAIVVSVAAAAMVLYTPNIE